MRGRKTKREDENITNEKEKDRERVKKRKKRSKMLILYSRPSIDCLTVAQFLAGLALIPIAILAEFLSFHVPKNVYSSSYFSIHKHIFLFFFKKTKRKQKRAIIFSPFPSSFSKFWYLLLCTEGAPILRRKRLRWWRGEGFVQKGAKERRRIRCCNDRQPCDQPPHHGPHCHCVRFRHRLYWFCWVYSFLYPWFQVCFSFFYLVPLSSVFLVFTLFRAVFSVARNFPPFFQNSYSMGDSKPTVFFFSNSISTAVFSLAVNQI